MTEVFLIEGIDFLGKSTLIKGLKDRFGYFTEFHRQKPELLQIYINRAKDIKERTQSNLTVEQLALLNYQTETFKIDMQLIAHAYELGFNFNILFDRCWLGEAVYSSMYRGYDGNYVFDLEKQYNMHLNVYTKLILLTEDFSVSKHFVDDGLSFDITKRQEEQKLFTEAYFKSIIQNKRIICVTDPKTGQFKSKDIILAEALS